MRAMQLQPIVGTPCAVCDKRILVDSDGKNCKRCGAAVHRDCGKEHKEKCSHKPAVSQEAHDWDDAGTKRWTPTLLGPLAAGAALAMVGVGRWSSSGDAGGLTLGLVLGGLALAAGGFVLDRR